MAKTKDEKALIADIVKMRDKDGLGWSEITEKTGLSTGKAMLLHMRGTIKERFKGTTDAALAKEVVAARKAGDSWGVISVKGGFSEARARALYEQGAGKPYSEASIGKGGRTANGSAPAKKAPAKKAAAAKKGTSKASAPKKSAAKAGGKKAAAKSGQPEPSATGQGSAGGSGSSAPPKGTVIPLREMTLEQLQGRLNGKTITVGRSTKPVRIEVDHISDLDDSGLMTFVAAKNKAVRTVQVDDIIKASR